MQIKFNEYHCVLLYEREAQERAFCTRQMDCAAEKKGTRWPSSTGNSAWGGTVAKVTEGTSRVGLEEGSVAGCSMAGEGGNAKQRRETTVVLVDMKPPSPTPPQADSHSLGSASVRKDVLLPGMAMEVDVHEDGATLHRAQVADAGGAWGLEANRNAYCLAAAVELSFEPCPLRKGTFSSREVTRTLRTKFSDTTNQNIASVCVTLCAATFTLVGTHINHRLLFASKEMFTD